MASKTACELCICATEASCNAAGNLLTSVGTLTITRTDGYDGIQNTYWEVEKNRNGLVPLNACTTAMHAARAAKVRRIVAVVEAAIAGGPTKALRL